jgi:hypothetical protein
MAWDFSTEPEFQARLDWASEFVVHQVTIAGQLIKDREPSQGAWPSRWLPPRVEESRQRYADAIESVVGNL